jgi:hypothetical protein
LGVPNTLQLRTNYNTIYSLSSAIRAVFISRALGYFFYVFRAAL